MVGTNPLFEEGKCWKDFKYIKQCITNVSLIIKPFINHFKADISETLNSTCSCIQYIHQCTELCRELWSLSEKKYKIHTFRYFKIISLLKLTTAHKIFSGACSYLEIRTFHSINLCIVKTCYKVNKNVQALYLD